MYLILEVLKADMLFRNKPSDSCAVLKYIIFLAYVGDIQLWEMENQHMMVPMMMMSGLIRLLMQEVQQMLNIDICNKVHAYLIILTPWIRFSLLL